MLGLDVSLLPSMGIRSSGGPSSIKVQKTAARAIALVDCARRARQASGSCIVGNADWRRCRERVGIINLDVAAESEPTWLAGGAHERY